MIDVDWAHLGSISAAVGVGGAIVALMLRGWLSGRYATTAQVGELEDRVASVEQSTQGMLRQGDLREMERRIGGLEVGLAGVRAEVRGIGETTKSINHMVELLVQQGLEGAAK